jgi:hypothetical protein
VAVFAFDLLPNSQSDFLPLVYAGALFTLSERLRARAVPTPALALDPEPARGDVRKSTAI